MNETTKALPEALREVAENGGTGTQVRGLLNMAADRIERMDNAYPALTARVKELEEKAAALVRYCDHFSNYQTTRDFWLRNFQNVIQVEDMRAALNKEPTT